MFKKKSMIGILIAISCLTVACSEGKDQNSKKQSATDATTTTLSEIDSTEKDIASEDYVEAVEQIRGYLSKVVGVNENLSDDDRNKMFDELVQDIQNNKTDGKEVYYRLKNIISAIKCAHLQLTFPNNNPYKYEGLPINFKWMDDKLIILNADEDNKKYLGCSVEAINGFDTKKLVDKYATINSYETESGKKASLEESLLFKTDLVYLGIMNEEDSVLAISIETRNGEKKDIEVKLVGYDQIAKSYSIMDLEGAAEKLPLAYQVRIDSQYANYEIVNIT